MFFLRFIIGGLLIAGIPLLAKHSNSKVAGVLLLIPAISIGVLYLIARDQGAQAAAKVSYAAIFGILPLLLFFITAHFAFHKYSQLMALSLSGVVWLVSAGMLILVTK